MAMICCKNNVYMIFSDSIEADNGVNFDKMFDKHFEVDELIAVPIVELNRKGYITTFSCAGHPFFWSLEYKNHEEEQEHSKSIFYDKEDHLYFYADRYNGDQAYIAFEKEYEFDTLPDGWYKDKNAIRIDYPENLSNHELYRVIMKAVDSLYIWVSSLACINHN